MPIRLRVQVMLGPTTPSHLSQRSIEHFKVQRANGERGRLGRMHLHFNIIPSVCLCFHVGHCCRRCLFERYRFCFFC